jgi:hypothetical protein
MVNTGIRFHRRVGDFNTVQRINRDALTNQLFNASQHATLFRIAQRNRYARRACST